MLIKLNFYVTHPQNSSTAFRNGAHVTANHGYIWLYIKSML